ncbi:hypothetical protein [Clostridium perfringens]|nr:hypothetical protein [Clostridium perfringens]
MRLRKVGLEKRLEDIIKKLLSKLKIEVLLKDRVVKVIVKISE